LGHTNLHTPNAKQKITRNKKDCPWENGNPACRPSSNCNTFVHAWIASHGSSKDDPMGEHGRGNVVEEEQS